MKLFEGKSPTERNKIIAAIVIGALAVLALGNMIFSPFSGSKKNITVNLSPSPTASASPNRNGDTVVTALPKQNEIDAVYISTPVVVQYPPSASDAGRNIFAFYEPPVPTPFSPTPIVVKETKTPTPIPPPQPNIVLSYISKQSVYEGDKGFKLDVGGDKFTPETSIWFGGTPLPTTFISPQQLSAEIPANYIAGAGQKTIEVKSADGKLFSNPIYFNVQAPPKPQFSYIGIVSRKRGNNDTAYVMEQGKNLPSSYRLNDIIGGRFRLVSISPAKLLVQDIQLGFLPPYSMELVKGSGQTSSSTTTRQPNPNFPDGFNPNPQINTQCPPGIPCNLKPYPTPQQQKSDDDVDDDGDN
jgi:hypothetical protein